MADCGVTGSRTSSSDGGSAIPNLGEDHLYSILLLLPVESVVAFAMTCKKLRAMASSDSLWESICVREWGPTSVEGFKKSSKDRRPLPWMSLYKMVSRLDSVSCEKLVSESFPDPRASHSLNFVSDCLVLFGGGREGGRHLDDTWVAYIGGKNGQRTVKWNKVNSGVPSGRFGHSCVTIGDLLLLFGGIDDHGNRLNDSWVGQLVHRRSAGEANIVTLTWSLLDVGPISPPPRGAHGACRVASRTMAIHGGIGPGGVRFGDTWVLELSDNPRRGEWRQIAADPCPPARSGHTLTRVGGGSVSGCSVLFGGRGVGYEVLDDLWLLESRGDRHEWVRIPYEFQNSAADGASLPRVGHSASGILGGRVLIFGGEDSSRHRKDDFWVLDLTGVRSVVSETRSAKMWRGVKVNGCKPTCRSFHRACADQSGRCVYVFGGMVDGLVGVAEPFGLRFDGEFFVVDLVHQM